MCQDDINPVAGTPTVADIISGDIDGVNVVVIPIYQLDQFQLQLLQKRIN